jgi:hypothetical protein
MKYNRIISLSQLILSLSIIPFIIFISIANSLFLANQAEPRYELVLYVPFLIIFLLTSFIAIGIYFLFQKQKNKTIIYRISQVSFLFPYWFLNLESQGHGSIDSFFNLAEGFSGRLPFCRINFK